MTGFDNSLPDLVRLLHERLAVAGMLAESLEASRLALRRNDAEAIARGAAHQAELCRQWGQLEQQLRAQAARRRMRAVAAPPADSPEAQRSAQLEADWQALATRIRYLTRVHWSLLRHMQRSLAIWSRVAASCAPTYAPAAGPTATSQARAGE